MSDTDDTFQAAYSDLALALRQYDRPAWASLLATVRRHADIVAALPRCDALIGAEQESCAHAATRFDGTSFRCDAHHCASIRGPMLMLPYAPDMRAPAAVANRPTLYRHYKGGLYHLLMIAQSSENPEQQIAIYRSVDGGLIWARPLSRIAQAPADEDCWMDMVTWPDGTVRRRFEEV